MQAKISGKYAIIINGENIKPIYRGICQEITLDSLNEFLDNEYPQLLSYNDYYTNQLDKTRIIKL